MMILAPTTRQRSAFSLVELVVSVGISTVVMGIIMYSFLFSSRSFVAMGNYMALNTTSLIALDKMTRDIREASSLKYFAVNQLVFLDASSNQLTYAWDPNSRNLTRSLGNATTILLHDCDFLCFAISQRSPTTDGVFGFYPATNNPAICKLVSVSWRCSRTILGEKVNTECVQTAKIAMRN